MEQWRTEIFGYISRMPRRQMRKYLPCGEKFLMSLATVAKTKTRCFHNTYES